MKKFRVIKILAIALLCVTALLLVSCSSDPQERLHLGYEYTYGGDYEVAFYTDTPSFNDSVTLNYSHGRYGWEYKGEIYENVDKVTLSLINDAGEEKVLKEAGLFEYMDNYFYTNNYNLVKNNIPVTWHCFQQDMTKRENKTTLLYEELNYLYFSNEESVELDKSFFPSDEGYITFKICEHYPDGTVKTVREISLSYKHEALGVVELYNN